MIFFWKFVIKFIINSLEVGENCGEIQHPGANLKLDKMQYFLTNSSYLRKDIHFKKNPSIRYNHTDNKFYISSPRL